MPEPDKSDKAARRDPLLRVVVGIVIVGLLALAGLAVESLMFEWEGFWRGAGQPYATALAALDAARHKPANPTLGALDPVLYTAARQEIPFGINTLHEAAQLRQSLETHRPPKLQGVAITRG